MIDVGSNNKLDNNENEEQQVTKHVATRCNKCKVGHFDGVKEGK
jgi:hypothetical protein